MLPDDPPAPVAAIARRAREAKSPKERHDTAYFGWEASVRLALAARPPADPSPLALASIGRWVGALSLGGEAHAAPEVLAAYALLSEVGLGRRAAPRSVTARRLLDALPAYRNEVIGHGAPRASGFYDAAGEALLAGLHAAWREGVFWPRGARLEREEAAGAGARLFARLGEARAPLHPWVLAQASDLGERTLFFNGRGRVAQYLDYMSGESLRGRALEEAFPGIGADLDALLRAPLAAEGEPEAADPALFGEYRVLGKLGEGGMGVVHLARQEGLSRLVALKRLPPAVAADATARARFRREVAALARCDNPNVVKVLACGEAHGQPYYAMELVEGADLAAVAGALAAGHDLAGAVARATRERLSIAAPDLFPTAGDATAAGPPGPPAPRLLAALMRDAARGLDALHEAGIVHRDVKPANVMVTAGDLRAVVMDLGLAAVEDASRSLTRERGALVGTLRYMAPEQLERREGPPDRRVDVYGLGASFYELLAGRPLLDGDSEARLLEQVRNESPAPLSRAAPRLPRDLATVVEKAIAKDPARRYESAAALAADLNAFLEGRPIAARPPTLGYVLALAVRRRKALAATAALALLVIVAGTSFFVARESSLRRAAEEREREAVRSLARALHSEGKRALAANDPLAAEALFARSLATEDVRETRERLLEARARGARVAWRSGGAVVASGVAVTADGGRVVTSGTGRAIRVLEAASGRVLASRGDPADEGASTALAVAPDGRRIAVGSDDGVVRIHDIATLEVLRSLRGPQSWMVDVAFRPDGGALASCDSHGVAAVFDLAQEGQSPALTIERRGLRAIAWSPDGRRLAAASRFEPLRLLDPASGDEVATLGDARLDVTDVAFDPDGGRIAAAGVDGTVRIFDVASGREAAVLRGHTGPAECVAWSPDGRVLLSGGGEGDERVRLRDAATGEERLSAGGLHGPVFGVAFAADGRGILACGGFGHAVVRIDLDAEPAARALRGHAGPVAGVAFSPDGGRLASAGAEGDQVIRVVEPESGRLLAALATPGERGAGKLAWSPDGRRLASCPWDFVLRVFDAGTGAETFATPHDTNAFSGVAWSPDGRRIATSRSGGAVRVIDAASGRTLREAPDPGGPVLAIAWSPEGRRIASGGQTGEIEVRDADTGALLLVRPHRSPVRALAWSGEGARLAAGDSDGLVHLVEVAGATETATLAGHARDVTGLAFTREGRLVSSGADGTLRVWDVAAAAARERWVLRGHESAVDAVAASPDGRWIASGGRDRLVRIWDVGALERFFAAAPADLLAEAERRTHLRVEGVEVAPLPLEPPEDEERR